MHDTSWSAGDVGDDVVLFRALTGASQRWLAICRAAVTAGADATQRLLGNDSAEARVFASQSLRPDDGGPGESGSDESLLTEEPENPAPAQRPGNIDLSAAYALASLARGLTGAIDIETACTSFLTHAGRAGQHSVGTQLLPAGTAITGGHDLLGGMVLHLLGRGDQPGRGYAILTALELAGRRPARLRAVQISVLFGSYNGRHGVAGRLHLEQVRQGPSGLHPDPASMGFLHADDEFIAGLHAAWAATRLAGTDACVLWSISVDHGASANTIKGGSLAAAFAVALDDLAPRMPSRRRPNLRHLRVRSLDPRCAVTAGLRDSKEDTPDRYRLTVVDRYGDKLSAAQERNLRVVVAADGEAEARNAAPADYSHRITGADTLRQAIRYARTRVNYTLWTVLTAVVLIVSAMTVVVLYRPADSVADSVAIAAKADSERDTDPALAQQLALAAYRTSRTLQARSALLDSTATPTPVRLSLPQLNDFNVNRTGGIVVSASLDGTVALTAITDTGVRPLREFTTAAPLRSVALSPDSRLVLTAANPGITLWDISSPAAPRRIASLVTSDEHPSGVAFSPDGKQVAVSTANGRILRWDVTDSTHPRTLTTLELPPPDTPATMHSGRMRLTFTGDSHALVAARYDGRTLRVWDFTGGLEPTRHIDTHLDAGEVQALASSVDGTTLAVGSPAKIRLWHVDTSLQISPTQLVDLDPNDGVYAVSFSADGTRLAISTSTTGAMIRSLTNPPTVTKLPTPDFAFDVAFTRNDLTLITISGDMTHLDIWTLPGPLLPVTPDPIRQIALGRNGTTMLAGTTTLTGINASYLWDLADPRGRHLIQSPDDHRATGVVAITRDGTIAAVADENTVQLWNIADPTLPMRIGPPIPAPADSNRGIDILRFLPDPKVLIIGAGPQQLWNIADPANPLPMHTLAPPTDSLDLSSDGQLLAASTSDRTIKLWNITDPANPLPLPDITGLPPGRGFPLAFSRTGRYLAVDTDSTITLYDLTVAQHPQRVATIDSDTGADVVLNYSPDGRLLEKATTKNGIWLWDVTNPKHPTRYAMLRADPGTVNDVEFLGAGAGDRLAAADHAGTVRLWTLNSDHLADTICASDTALITTSEWESRLPGIRMPTLCP